MMESCGRMNVTFVGIVEVDRRKRTLDEIVNMPFFQSITYVARERKQKG
jgi:hypothetical protein